jgi:aspartate-semialdehyde dehydrogenase
MPESVADMILEPTRPDLGADLCFSALPTDAAAENEAALAKAGHHVFSNASIHRMDADVPNLLAEVNFDHVHALEQQRKTRGWSGSIVTNGNCTAIHLTLALAPLHRDFGVEELVVTTMQAISGAGYPGVPSLDVLDNVVPYIGGEEDKVVEETQKFLGAWDANGFAPARFPMSVHCNRVLVRDGHTETVSVRLTGAPGVSAVRESFRRFRGRPQELRLPSAPEHPIVVRDEADRPQPLLGVDDLDEHRQILGEPEQARGVEVCLRAEARVPADDGGAGDPPLAEQVEDRAMERTTAVLIALADIDAGQKPGPLDLHATALPRSRPTTTTTTPRAIEPKRFARPSA